MKTIKITDTELSKIWTVQPIFILEWTQIMTGDGNTVLFRSTSRKSHGIFVKNLQPYAMCKTLALTASCG